MKASARELRSRLHSIMQAVDRGETVLITHRGKPRAKIVPLRRRDLTPSGDNPFVGMWKDRKDMKDVRRYVRGLRQGRFT
ncbi:MAG: type II toxin-antitoxin system prevent-host-death family antitoxin [Planctomycetota bacterium]